MLVRCHEQIAGHAVQYQRAVEDIEQQWKRHRRCDRWTWACTLAVIVSHIPFALVTAETEVLVDRLCKLEQSEAEVQNIIGWPVQVVLHGLGVLSEDLVSCMADPRYAIRPLAKEPVKSCMVCETRFSILRRKHSCKSCGAVVCAECSSTRGPVAGYREPK